MRMMCIKLCELRPFPCCRENGQTNGAQPFWRLSVLVRDERLGDAIGLLHHLGSTINLH